MLHITGDTLIVFADLAAPLHQLTHNNAEFQWTEECNNAFESIKKRLTEAPVLAFPCFDRQAGTMVLQTDASGVGLGAVLEQEGHVIGYASRTLSRSESNYSVIQRECLAIVWGMKQFSSLPFRTTIPVNDRPCTTTVAG